MSTGSSVPSLAPRPAAPKPRAKNVIAVASGKGGVGKTWFSISLTHALTRAGQRTLLFDGDLGLANVDIQLGLMPKHDLGAVVTGRLTLNQAAVNFPEGGFDVIAGRSGSGSLANIPLSRLQILADDLVLLAGGYDRVVLDLGAGVEKTVRALANQAGTVLVVTTDEPTSLTDAYAFIKLSNAAGHGGNIRIVVNMTGSEKEGEGTYNTILKACKNFLKLSPPLLGIIRQDKKVREAIRAQTPFLTRSPNSETAEDIEKVAARVVSEILI